MYAYVCCTYVCMYVYAGWWVKGKLPAGGPLSFSLDLILHCSGHEPQRPEQTSSAGYDALVLYVSSAPAANDTDEIDTSSSSYNPNISAIFPGSNDKLANCYDVPSWTHIEAS